MPSITRFRAPARTARPRGSAVSPRSTCDALEPRRMFVTGYLVAATGAGAAIFDDAHHMLYVTAGSSVLRFDLNAKKTLSPWKNVGHSLAGGDITPDEKSLYLADETIVAGQSMVQKIDLKTGTVKTMPYDIDYDDAANGVIITSDNKAIISHTGQWGDIHAIDTRDDHFATSSTTNIFGGLMYRGRDRSFVVSSDDLSPQSGTFYDAIKHKWSSGFDDGLGQVAISPDGTEIATNNGYVNRSLKVLRARSSDGSPLGFDPEGKLLYTLESNASDTSTTAGGGKVVVRDRKTNARISSFGVASDVKDEVPALGAVSDDGHWLALMGTKGVHVYDVSGTRADSSISGNVYNDANGDGQRDVAELGVGMWTLYLDANNNGRLDGGERTTRTHRNGHWSFDGLAAGTYVVQLSGVEGAEATSPSSGRMTLTVGAGKSLKGKAFGVRGSD